MIRVLAALQKLSKKGTFLPFITMIMVMMTKPTTAANKVNHKKKNGQTKHLNSGTKRKYHSWLCSTILQDELADNSIPITIFTYHLPITNYHFLK